ncbi:lipoyl(octanoyl) transferase [Fluviicoccus keumensis]|uniref:Octanoyltransferase n=1 Tax=Fluviicoccus keumensis TaxID=1435465 RepID=A0A4Q7Z9P8_9GAMM|nr:lipoyl(octanoyl) transferase LipB [Fluviicoccus keumensis]RZU47250.1 lipoyl(octanoyl) transferase [Fluviicoccus keumensis]
MLTVRHVSGDFQTVWQAMRDFTDQRTPDTPDELWYVQHPPVFTLGQAGKPEHILAAGDIPVVKTDRGGQVTYHGPGQLVGYCLFDLRRTGTGVRELVEFIEDCLVDVLRQHGIAARADRDAHGVYVDTRKIASLGLRIRKGCSYHGFALNVDMDPEPFTRINPCGYTGLQMTTVQREATVMPSWQALEEGIRLALEKTF